MPIEADRILSILDRCCDNFTFPMLDNGYWYLAATRLSLYRSAADWAMAIEVFGYNPRYGIPDTHIATFASTLCNRMVPKEYVTPELHQAYLVHNPNNECHFIEPIDRRAWLSDLDGDLVAEGVAEGVMELVLRDRRYPVPSLDAYAKHGIELEDPSRVQILSFAVSWPLTRETQYSQPCRSGG
jgi:hypothetical protein